MEFKLVFNLLGAIVVVAVFAAVGVLYWRKGRGSSRSEAGPDTPLVDPTANQTLGQMGLPPGGLDKTPAPNAGFSGDGGSGDGVGG